MVFFCGGHQEDNITIVGRTTVEPFHFFEKKGAIKKDARLRFNLEIP
jgi:hypothetical protein